MDLKELSLAVQNGSAKKTKELVIQALEAKIMPEFILNEAMIKAMGIVCTKFQDNEIYVPEMLLTARAMAMGLQILEPVMEEAGAKPIGKCVIGTVRGDLHDIGKNLVKLMFKSAGIDVVDLGVDVPAVEFLEKAEAVGADIVCLSALLTTTMPAMADVIRKFEKAGVKGKYVFMVGGAPVSNAFAKQINADYYTPDAGAAVRVAKALLMNRAGQAS
ncbi:MAG TPA: corrinoid protein [Anaerovoracaceae bacterium]|nr:corrinoid protein [Anaerovoracaceae bacterium]